MTGGVAILGSCVTRDAFRDDASGPALTVLSRTSLASLFAPRIDGLALPDTLGRLKPGGFGDRCVRADIEKTGMSFIEDQRPEILILDFMDERLALRQVGASIVTYSNDFAESGLAATAPFSGGRTIERLSTEAWTLWLDGLAALRARVSCGLLSRARIILHCSALALRWKPGSGDAVLRAEIGHPGRRMALMRANRLLARQHEVFLEAFPEAVAITVPNSLTIADGAHIWGPAPFHYIPDYYDAFAATLRAHGVATTRV